MRGLLEAQWAAASRRTKVAAVALAALALFLVVSYQALRVDREACRAMARIDASAPDARFTQDWREARNACGRPLG